MRTNVLWPAGALALAGEAAVHVQQYLALFHDVRWIGPLFLANAVVCGIVIAGLACRPTRDLAALAGVATSAVALASLIVSYGQGLFGWQEAGFRPIVELTVIFELAAVVLLSAALAAAASSPTPLSTGSASFRRRPAGRARVRIRALPRSRRIRSGDTTARAVAVARASNPAREVRARSRSDGGS